VELASSGVDQEFMGRKIGRQRANFQSTKNQKQCGEERSSLESYAMGHPLYPVDKEDANEPDQAEHGQFRRLLSELGSVDSL